MRWDIFCHVVDNFGDIGVCWRLARDLASRGQGVRLLVDDRRALAWMAGAAPGVEVKDWPSTAPALPLPDVVVEAFGCQLPELYLRTMAGAATPPHWINLEYLSAQAYVERSHGLPSPQGPGPARGLVKHFFYPGFTTATGGLLREPGLLEARARFDREAWLSRHATARQAEERVVLLFGYPNPAVPALLDTLAQAPTLLLLPRGALQDQALAALRDRAAHDALRHVALPYLSQIDFDHLLWSSDLNFVRGEDSLVRALWAGAPFVWQIYPQADGVHRDKLRAFVDRLLEGVSAADGAPVRAWFEHWNGLDGAIPALPDLACWHRLVLAWQARLAAQDDLTTQLLGFVTTTR